VIAAIELRAAGDYEVRLTVTDPSGRDNSSVVRLRSEPTAIELDGGPDRTVKWQVPVELSASVSVEADRAATITWALVERPVGSSSTITATGESTASFVPDAAGRYTARVTVETVDSTQSDDVVILANAQAMLLAHDPMRMEYADALDRIVTISAFPPSLHVLDPVGETERSVALPALARHLSVEPGGARAAVGHENGVTIVGLDPPSIIDTFPVPTITTANVACVFGTGNLVHCFSQSGHIEAIRTVDLSSGTVTEGDAAPPKSAARLHPSTEAIYSPSRIFGPRRYDVSGVPVTLVRWVDDPTCDALWFTEDGAAIVTGCGAVLHSSDDAELDMIQRAQLINIGSFRWVSDSLAAGRIAVLWQASAINFYDRDTLASAGSSPIPDTLYEGQFHQGFGRFLAYRSDRSELYAIADADVAHALFILAP
jgi:hypothetical protein